MPEKIKIVFLGTGSATPTAKRNHLGILFSYANENILIDCGEGIQRQFKIAKISPCKLTKILITHWHGDHTLGLTGLLETLEMDEYSKTLEIYGPKGTKHNLELLEKIYGKFRIKHNIYEVSNKKFFETSDLIIDTLPMTHGIPANAYSITIKDKLRLNKKALKKLELPNSPLLKKLQQGKNIIHPKTKNKIFSSDVTYLEKGKKVTFILDTSINPNASKLAKNSDLIICESSFSSLHASKAKDYKHLLSSQAAEIAKKSKSKKLILTHLSHRYQKDSSQLLNEAKKIFPHTTIVNDFETVEI